MPKTHVCSYQASVCWCPRPLQFLSSCSVFHLFWGTNIVNTNLRFPGFLLAWPWLTPRYPLKELCQVGYMASNGLSFNCFNQWIYPFDCLNMSHFKPFIAREFFSFMKWGSRNGGTPKSPILKGFSLVNHPAIVVPPFWETPTSISWWDHSPFTTTFQCGAPHTQG